MQNFGVTDKDHYGMFWYFLEWSIQLTLLGAESCFNIQGSDFQPGSQGLSSSRSLLGEIKDPGNEIGCCVRSCFWSKKLREN